MEESVLRFVKDLRQGRQPSPEDVTAYIEFVWSRFLNKVRYRDSYEDILYIVAEKFMDKVEDGSFKGTTIGEVTVYMHHMLRTELYRMQSRSNTRKNDVSMDSENYAEKQTEAAPNEPEEWVIDCELQQALEECVLRLPDEMAEVIRIILFRGVLQEFGRRMRYSAAKVSRIKTKAFKLLRECMISKGFNRRLMFQND